MDGHTTESLCEVKNDIIHKVQDLFFEYNRMSEVVIRKELDIDLDKHKMNQTIKNMHDTDQVRITTIEALEGDILRLQKTNHEYSELIKTMETKLAEKQEEQVVSDKFDMLKSQAREITQKDREIERLNRLIFNFKNKGKGKGKGSGGSPPTSNTDPIMKQSTVIQEVLENTSHITSDVEVQEVDQEEVLDIFTWHKKEYATIIGDLEPNVYELLDGDVRGEKIGTWTLTKTKKKKLVKSL